MSGSTLKDWKKKQKIRDNTNEDKMRESPLRWFDHLDRRPRYTIVRRTNCLEVIGTSTVEREGDLRNLVRNYVMSLRHLILWISLLWI